jgi:rubrerythrin
MQVLVVHEHPVEIEQERPRTPRLVTITAHPERLAQLNDADRFLEELDALRDRGLGEVVAAGRGVTEERGEHDPERLLRIALANEIGVSDLAARFAAASPEPDVKIAFARQAGDEARHFELVASRLQALGFNPEAAAAPGPNPLFEYLRERPGSIERVAGGLYALEAIAFEVNRRFMQVCALRGDQETVRLYREFIQPDEEAHAALGRALLGRHARTGEDRERARATVVRTLELAAAQRARAAEVLGTRSFPGC